MDPMSNSSEQETDLSQGYQVIFQVLPDGFKVSDPEPLQEPESDPEEESEDDSLIPDMASALKNLMHVVQANPVGESEQSGFDSVAQKTGNKSAATAP